MNSNSAKPRICLRFTPGWQSTQAHWAALSLWPHDWYKDSGAPLNAPATWRGDNKEDGCEDRKRYKL